MDGKSNELGQVSLNTAQLLVKCLEEEGVKYIFGIPGEENLEVMNAIYDSTIEFITTRHEQGAAFMADIYGRLTGKAGVCLATLGPGATNLVTGVADAHSDGAPLVAITGQVGTERMHITSHQFLDLCKMFEPITKKTKMIVRPNTVNEIVRIAFKYAESEKPGACHIDLPVNIAKMPVDSCEKPLLKKVQPKEFAELETIEEAAAEIFKAKNPVILAGSSAVRAQASEALTKFATDLKIPVIVTMMSKGIIPCNNPYFISTIGIPQKDYVNKVIENADLVIAVGYDIVEYAPAKWNPNGSIEIIHIDSSQAHINKLYQPKVEVVGDISDSLLKVALRTSRKNEPVCALGIKEEIEKEHESYSGDLSFPMKPQKILNDVRKVMGPDDIIVSDVGAHKMWIARHYNCYKPNTCIISNGFATMGIGVPGAIAAKLINPDKKVLTITGDGGFMMNSQEIETAIRIGTPFVTLVFNDNNYGLIKWKQEEQYGKSCYVEFTNPDFVKLAEGMNAKGYRIEKAEDLIPTLEEAFKQTVPVIIDCPVDYDENLRLTEQLKKIYKG
ncbi:acetolactate synthase large subunit [Clostridium chromiireducens]|uniref:Acetolactate synthase large subunit n=1 Tax=Clostridium chromiireducens TaxID=225345 RepID=A0A1V4IMI5_9CLOT|nr:acetolactate synthase large subunit [Clostridium chromiireducens]OPJ61242.1 acetolactate synthase, catabolic [Clostridium chromiireducens]RII36081.1 acetolactate synthase large subunit [Clostridium chromiireducens]